MKENVCLTIDDAKELINYALTEFYMNDAILLDYKSEDKSVSERCMVFHIGYYLTEKIKNDPNLSCYDVDAEYNRNFNAPKGLYKETLEGVIKKTKNAIPDLLLHKRRSNKHNLICFEFKKGTPSDMSNDIEKLSYFTDSNGVYKYQYGFYIWLYKNKAKVKIFQSGKEMCSLFYEWKLSIK